MRTSIARGAIGFVLIATAVWLAWGRATQAWFAADDFLFLTNSNWPSIWHSFAGAAGVIADFRPLVRVSYGIDFALWGLHADGWHATNLILHLASCLLLARLVRQLSNDRWLAVGTACLFAVIPVLSDNVIWISGRTNTLGSLFCLLALICFDLFARRGVWPWLLAASLAGVAGLASYEPAVVLPGFCVVVALLRWREVPWRRLVWGIAAITLALLLLLVWRRIVIGPGTTYTLRPFTLASFAASGAQAWAVLHEMLGRGWWAAVLAPILLRRGEGAMRAAVLAGLAAAVISLLPYAPFPGVGIRFFYPAAMGVALAIAAIARAAGRLAGDLARLRGAAPVGFALIMLLTILPPLHGARAYEREWIGAGKLGRRIMANLRAANPHPDPRALHILLGLPIQYRRAGLFFTFPDLAVRQFAWPAGGPVVAGHQMLFRPESFALFLVRLDIAAGEKDAPSRACLDGVLDRAHDIAGFLAGLPACRADYWQIGPAGQVRRMDLAAAQGWLRRQTLSLSAP